MAEALDTPTGGDSSNRPALPDHAGSDTDAPRFSLGSLLAGMAWLCFLLAVARVSPALSLLLVILSLPSVGRAAWLRGEYERRGLAVTLGTKCWLFLSSVGAIFAAASVGIGAFVIVCAIFAGAILTVIEIFRSETVFALSMLLPIPAFCVGLAAGIWAGVQFESLLRPRILDEKEDAETPVASDRGGYNPSTSVIE